MENPGGAGWPAEAVPSPEAVVGGWTACPIFLAEAVPSPEARRGQRLAVGPHVLSTQPKRYPVRRQWLAVGPSPEAVVGGWTAFPIYLAEAVPSPEARRRQRLAVGPHVLSTLPKRYPARRHASAVGPHGSLAVGPQALSSLPKRYPVRRPSLAVGPQALSSRAIGPGIRPRGRLVQSGGAKASWVSALRAPRAGRWAKAGATSWDRARVRPQLRAAVGRAGVPPHSRIPPAVQGARP